jgi:hypothetical protein
MAKHGGHSLNQANPRRHKLLKKTSKRIDLDGLSSLKYYVTNILKTRLFTKIMVTYDENDYSQMINEYTQD